jgi:protein-tyrosine phosphatase
MEIIGAIKVKDALFIGDEWAAQDLEFVVANKVTHIINCSARQVPNHWEPIGVTYLTYYWFDHDSQVILDSKDTVFRETYAFIERAVEQGESVLIQSVRGQSRCIVITAAYLMRKYRWSLFKTLEFLNSRRADIDIRPNFVHQLAALESRLSAQNLGPKTSKWTELSGEPVVENEEVVLRNTYLNSQPRIYPEHSLQDGGDGQQITRLSWPDKNTGNTKMLVDISPDTCKNTIENGYVILKSCIKGKKAEYRLPVYRPKTKGTRRARPEPAVITIPRILTAQMPDNPVILAISPQNASREISRPEGLLNKPRPSSASKDEDNKQKKVRGNSAGPRESPNNNKRKLLMSSQVPFVQSLTLNPRAARDIELSSSAKLPVSRALGMKKKRPSTANQKTSLKTDFLSSIDAGKNWKSSSLGTVSRRPVWRM